MAAAVDPVVAELLRIVEALARLEGVTVPAAEQYPATA